jgi:AAA family ATP:ADP antiporter
MVAVEPGEISATLLAFAYFFCLLCAYYILRPVRDEMGIQGGVENLQWVFTATFVAMLAAVPVFGAAAARLPRRRLVPLVYVFFILNLVIFYLLLRGGVATGWVARAFFVWLSVFNLFVVSVFWSFMADIFDNAQARRLFGFIAAGGSAGAVAGPSLTAALAPVAGPVNLLLVSAAFLLAALACVIGLGRTAARSGPAAGGEAVGGTVLGGVRKVLRSPYLLGICAYIVLYTTLSTFLYFEQARIVRDAFTDPARRTAVFAWMDLAVNVLTITTQVLATGRLVAWMGVAATLALVPALVAAGFLLLGTWPTLAVLIGFQVVRRAGNYAIARPAREMLFTVVGREEKYKSKNFIDTVVYRGGDAVSGWVFTGLSAIGFGLSAIAYTAVPVAALWGVTGWLLGRAQERRREGSAGANAAAESSA